MNYIRNRAAHAVQSFFGIMVAIVGVALGLAALCCVAMMVWMMVKIFFITTWMIIQAALWGIGGGLCVLGAYGLFKGSSALMRPAPKKHSRGVTIIP